MLLRLSGGELSAQPPHLRRTTLMLPRSPVFFADIFPRPPRRPYFFSAPACAASAAPFLPFRPRLLCMCAENRPHLLSAPLLLVNARLRRPCFLPIFFRAASAAPAVPLDSAQKKPPFREFKKWRIGRDSNSREALDPYTLSRRAPSTARPPIRVQKTVYLIRFQNTRQI